MSLRLGTVTQVNPSMLVAADGSTVGMPVTVYAPAGTPVVGDRVVFEPVDRLVVVVANVSASGRWSTYTPRATDPSNPATVYASTGASGKYVLNGKTCTCMGTVTITAAQANGAAVDLPFTAATRDLNIGSLETFGGTTPTGQSGVAAMTADKQRLVLVTNSFGFLATNAGNSIRWSGTYEIA